MSTTPLRSEAATLRDRTNESTRWSFMLRAAREDRAERVQRERTQNSMLWTSLSHRAQDYGLVPHPPTRAMGPLGTCCRIHIRNLAQAASLIRYRNSHRNSIYGMTVMQEVLTANAR